MNGPATCKEEAIIAEAIKNAVRVLAFGLFWAVADFGIPENLYIFHGVILLLLEVLDDILLLLLLPLLAAGTAIASEPI